MIDVRTAERRRSRRRRLVAGLLPSVVLVAACVAGPAAGAAVQPAARSAGRHDAAALSREIGGRRGRSGQRPEVGPPGSSRVAGGLIGPAVVTKVTGPALAYTDFPYTGPVSTIRDLTTGTSVARFGGLGGCQQEPRVSPDGTTEVTVGLFGADPATCSGTTSVLDTVTTSGVTGALATAPANAFFELPNWSPDG